MSEIPRDDPPVGQEGTRPPIVRAIRRDNPDAFDAVVDQATRTQTMPTVRPSARVWVPKFLAAYRMHGNISAAARQAGVARQKVYERIARSEKFKAAIDDAFAESTEVLEAAAFSRATKDKSDAVLMFLLKARRPQTYKDIMRTEHTVPPESAPMTFTLKIGREDADAPLTADNGRPA